MLFSNQLFLLASNLDCPPCYREVQKRVNRYRRDLDLLQNAISTLNSSQTLNSLREDKRLTAELDALAKNLNNLKADLNRTDEDCFFLFHRNLSNSFFCRSWPCLSKYNRL